MGLTLDLKCDTIQKLKTMFSPCRSFCAACILFQIFRGQLRSVKKRSTVLRP